MSFVCVFLSTSQTLQGKRERLVWSMLQKLQSRVGLGTETQCFFRWSWRWLNRWGHFVCTSKFTSDPRREGNWIHAMGWNSATRSCSWIWSLRCWISRQCISVILQVSSCSFSLMVGVMLGVSSLGIMLLEDFPCSSQSSSGDPTILGNAGVHAGLSEECLRGSTLEKWWSVMLFLCDGIIQFLKTRLMIKNPLMKQHQMKK